MSQRVLLLQDKTGTFHGWLIECPGCQSAHALDARWTFNGDLQLPTFTPSLHVSSKYGQPPVPTVCHSFITNGKIQYLQDSTHSLSGLTIDLPEFYTGER